MTQPKAALPPLFAVEENVGGLEEIREFRQPVRHLDHVPLHFACQSPAVWADQASSNEGVDGRIYNRIKYPDVFFIAVRLARCKNAIKQHPFEQELALAPALIKDNGELLSS